MNLTVRTRLTLTFGALFLVGGCLLVAGMMLSVRGVLFAPLPTMRTGAVADGSSAGQAVGPLVEEWIRTRLRDIAEKKLLWLGAVELSGVVLLSGAGGWVVSGRLLGRIRRVTVAARDAGEATGRRPLNLPGPCDEIKELGDTFDAMLARLDEAFDAQRRFVANASHELRTPLAVTRAAVEVTLARPDATVAELRVMGAEVIVAIERAGRLVNSLLLLSRSEQRLGPVEVDDLADLAAEALDLVRPRAQACAIGMAADLATAPVAGDLTLLSRAVTNLMDNAVLHNNNGGTVVVDTGTDGGQAWLRITNTGADLSAVDIDRLFEPFERGCCGRLDGEGIGLGLSIVRAVARAHHGAVAAAPRSAADGGGLTVWFRLPVAL